MFKAFTNATVFTGTETLAESIVLVKSGLVVGVYPKNKALPKTTEIIDLDGQRLVPGLVDIQVNGGGDVLFNNSLTTEGIKRICQAHLQFGTTSLLPTLITTDEKSMQQALIAVRDAKRQSIHSVLGIHLEGPFLNKTYRGAHDEAKMRNVNENDLALLTSLDDNTATLVTLAPEQCGMEFIETLSNAGVTVFIGHTGATYEQCKMAESAGTTGYTHLFNAMTPMQSRSPGVVGAALESDSAVFSIIADGQHSHPASFRNACKAKYQGGAILVTDAMSTVGGNETGFILNGETIEMRDGVIRNKAGSLAGSNLNMIDAVKNTILFANLDWQEAIRMASLYPARAIKFDHLVGQIKAGCFADFLVLDEVMNIQQVWQRGELCTV